MSKLCWQRLTVYIYIWKQHITETKQTHIAKFVQNNRQANSTQLIVNVRKQS